MGKVEIHESLPPESRLPGVFVTISKIDVSFRQHAACPDGENPEKQRKLGESLTALNHFGFAEVGVLKDPIIKLEHGDDAEGDEGNFDVEIVIGEGLGRIAGEEK